MKKINMTGQRFGRLIVLEEVGRNKHGKVMWKCQCDCGTVKIVCGSDLKSGNTKSCGCLNREKISEANKIDLKGQRFGKLLVFEETGRNKQGRIMWKCLCGCGITKIVCGHSLRNGDTKSCGCLQKEIASKVNKIDLVGQRFGRYVVLEYAYIKNRKVYWKCQCDCNGPDSIKVVCGVELRSSNTKSCGCLKKERMSNIKGEDHPNYNSNLTDEERIQNRDYPEYNKWRKAVFERDDYICQCCGKRGVELAAHHLESYANNLELRTSLENGITLCAEDEDCHGNFHHRYGYGNNTREQFEEFLFVQKKIERKIN